MDTLKPLNVKVVKLPRPYNGQPHEGHLTLVRKAREYADIVVVSIFVNPMQFDRADDLNNYPRTLEEDLSKLTAEASMWYSRQLQKSFTQRSG